MNSAEVFDNNPVEKFQTIDDLSFVEVPQSTPGAQEVLVIKNNSDESVAQATILDQLKSRLIKENWWLQDRWAKEGLPKEQLTATAGNNQIEIFNFNNIFAPEEIKEIEEALSCYQNLAPDIKFEFPKYILFPKTAEQNPQSHEPYYGKNWSDIKSVLIFPRAANLSPYRVKEISALQGTIIHELGHILQDNNPLSEQWQEKFGWEMVDLKTYQLWSQEKKEAKTTMMQTKFPERCLTKYAEVDDQEDICESIVGYFANSPDLDLEKKEFVKKLFFDGKESVSIIKNQKVVLPRLPEKIEYYQKERRKLFIIKK